MASRAAQILCLLFVLPFVKPDNPPISDFAHHANLDDSGDFQIFWNYDDENITIQYHAKSQGWAGLGFSPNGAMPGSDIALFWVDNTGQGMVSDRHGAAENGFPPEDEHQDYFLTGSAKNETHLIMTFHRKRNTCDKEDWKLTDDTTRVMYAKNDEVPQDKDHFKKHTIASTKSLHLFDDRVENEDGVPPEPGATSIEFHISETKVPDDKDTLYWCEFQAVPKIPEKRHIIKIEPVIQQENLDVVHHILIYICPKNASKYLNTPALCFDDPSPVTQAFGGCQTVVLSAWAKGGQSYTYPDNVGFPIENPNGDMVVMVEMHYDNSQYKKGKVDASGMRFWLTDKLRPIEGGRATIGKPVNTISQLIPPKQAQFTNYAYCSAQCTESFPKDGINILGGLLHTHLAGRKIRFLQFRQGKQLPNILDDEYYDFNYQDTRRKNVPALVLPGDELVVECVYETTDRNKTTVAGLSTHDEMCLIYADYYPAVNNGFICYSELNGQELMKILNVTWPPPPDYKINWTPRMVKDMQDAELNGKHVVVCNKPSSGSGEGDYYNYIQNGYPIVTDPLPTTDPCGGGGGTGAASGIKRGSFGVLGLIAVLVYLLL